MTDLYSDSHHLYWCSVSEDQQSGMNLASTQQMLPSSGSIEETEWGTTDIDTCGSETAYVSSLESSDAQSSPRYQPSTSINEEFSHGFREIDIYDSNSRSAFSSPGAAADFSRRAHIESQNHTYEQHNRSAGSHV